MEINCEDQKLVELTEDHVHWLALV